MKINRDKLVMVSVQGEISHPGKGRNPYRINTRNGKTMVLPGTGGITYNKKIGDICTGFMADHVEPGVSMKLKDENANGGLNVLSCVGNVAKVVSGDAKGDLGYVTGKHGGIEHVLVYFPEETLEKLTIGDKILVKSFGTGLEIEGFEDIHVMNLDPDLFDKMGVKVAEDGVLEVPVATEVPAYLMGSGIGSSNAYRGDYDIMTADPETYVSCGLNKLRFGDIVLLRDCDTTHGRGYLNGAVTIGVVVHSDCVLAGHGPGVTTLMTSKTTRIRGVKCENANIANYLGVTK
ncbi:DUF4438 domain-containing protein [Clostridium sp. 'deep sea']|uniref:DUF4438 domain-containing protein n=1 Tax=Clostridium sp. 'deep sea' TaxID=2779445 RepID=UPI001896A23E|nr:DUF4438 domain-containing protein [Clostridium sp. 'deep sea']QOR35733.1 DUF4438 domain-containing protein [Clostridium sp. 'deep sea']